MKCILKCFRSTLSACSGIHLVDRCLILIMFLLLIQSAFSLFFNPYLSPETNNIDSIIRTATASIFGYFLSSNFISHIPRENRNNHSPQPLESGRSGTSSISETSGYQIGFAAPSDPVAQQSGSLSVSEDAQDDQDAPTASHLQIKIATLIAVFCLLILTVIRNSSHGSQPMSASSQATVSQFRDLVSGCVGFLIGVPTTRRKT